MQGQSDGVNGMVYSLNQSIPPASSSRKSWQNIFVLWYPWYPLINGKFRILKWRYCTIFLARFFFGDITLHRLHMQKWPSFFGRKLQWIGSWVMAIDLTFTYYLFPHHWPTGWQTPSWRWEARPMAMRIKANLVVLQRGSSHRSKDQVRRLSEHVFLTEDQNVIPEKIESSMKTNVVF